MRNKVIIIESCQDCAFATKAEDTEQYFCTLDDIDNEIMTRYAPLKVGQVLLINREKCFFNHSNLTFKKVKLSCNNLTKQK